MHTIRAINGLLRVIKRPAFLAEVVATDFLPWYLWQGPERVLRSYVEYAKACNEILSIPFLLRTLFSPWKGIAEEMPGAFQWDKFLEAFFVNLVTRGIGMVIRLVAMACALALQIVVLAIFVVLFIGWFAFPVLALVGITFVVSLFL